MSTSSLFRFVVLASSLTAGRLLGRPRFACLFQRAIFSSSEVLLDGGLAAENLKVKIVEIPHQSRYFPAIR